MEDSFEPGKGLPDLDQCQARLYIAILRHARGRVARRPPPAYSRLIPVTIREVRRLLADVLPARTPGRIACWIQWRRRHQARSRWFH